MGFEVRARRLPARLWKAPTEPIWPVVRIVSTYRFQGGVVPFHGSGFVVEGWSNVVFTAAHVLPDVTHEDIEEIRVDVLDTIGRTHVAFARAYAFSPGERQEKDIAALWLDDALPKRSPTLRSHHFPAGEAPALACGFTLDGRYRTAPMMGHAETPFLVFDEGDGEAGMSGGPIVRDDHVYGLYLGELQTGTGPLAATGLSIDAELAFVLAKAAGSV
jgi:hypothetical protein